MEADVPLCGPVKGGIRGQPVGVELQSLSDSAASNFELSRHHFFFQALTHSVAQAVLEIIMYPRAALEL